MPNVKETFRLCLALAIWVLYVVRESKTFQETLMKSLEILVLTYYGFVIWLRVSVENYKPATARERLFSVGVEGYVVYPCVVGALRNGHLD